MCRKPAHYKIFREKFPALSQGHLSRKVHGYRRNFHKTFLFPVFLFLLNHSNTQVFCVLKNFLSVYSSIRTKPVTISKIFPRKQKDRDRRQKGGRSLARSLPDSHGQPGRDTQTGNQDVLFGSKRQPSGKDVPYEQRECNQLDKKNRRRCG